MAQYATRSVNAVPQKETEIVERVTNTTYIPQPVYKTTTEYKQPIITTEQTYVTQAPPKQLETIQTTTTTENVTVQPPAAAPYKTQKVFATEAQVQTKAGTHTENAVVGHSASHVPVQSAQTQFSTQQIQGAQYGALPNVSGANTQQFQVNPQGYQQAQGPQIGATSDQKRNLQNQYEGAIPMKR